MAGVTFLLNRHLNRSSFSRAVLRGSIEAFEAVGPWFLTLLCLSTMGITIQIMSHKIPVFFYLSLTYASAMSLIIASPFNTIFTRFMADEIFKANYQPIINGLVTVTICVVATTLTVSGFIVFTFSSIAFNEKIAFVCLTVLLSLFWCISACLATLQKERVLLVLFSIGIVVILALFAAAKPMKMLTLTLTYALGMAIPVGGGYAYTINLYNRSRITLEWGFFKRRDALTNGFAIFVFYLGFWIDKIVFWFSGKTGVHHDRLFHYYPDYDFPFFIAVTLMMLGSIFVYRGMKNKISEPYKLFIFKLENNFPFREIALEKFKLVDGISHVSGSILIFYGGITVFLLLLVRMGNISLPWGNPYVFHYLMIATIFFSIYFFYFLLLQYLDEYNVLLRINLFFFFVNFLVTLASVQLGFRYYGIGFLTASVTTTLIAFFILSSRIGGLEYYVFSKALKDADKA